MSALTLAAPIRIELDAPPSRHSIDALLETEFAEPRVGGLTRAQINQRIMAINPSASLDFLDSFGIEELASYLEHLDSASRPRGRWARRVRMPGTPGICWSARRF